MPRGEPSTTMQCNECGKLFGGNPRSQPLGRANYCSLACEEGRGRPPIHSPRSPDYHLHLKGHPEDLVGRKLIARGLKRVDYSPDWCKGPDDWSHGTVVSENRDELWYIRKDDVPLGEVVDYDGHYTVVSVNDTSRRIKDVRVVEMLKNDRWWAE